MDLGSCMDLGCIVLGFSAIDEEGERSVSRPKPDPGGGGRVDLISALPDDLLLQVLERLDSVAAAARTGLVSRRWRDLWTRLPKVTLTLHHAPFRSLLDALHGAAARPGLCHYHLDIRVPEQDDVVSGSRVSALLHLAARLSPAELRLTLPRNIRVYHLAPELPCFRRATSIELLARNLGLAQRMLYPGSTGPFHSLERLSLSGCHMDMATFLARCPRLRLLSVNTTDLVNMLPIITIHSASLEELVFEHHNRGTGLSRISVEAPVLKQLTMSFHARSDVEVSVLAPMVDKVSWRCLYTTVIYGLGLWGLSEVCVKTVEQTDSPCLQLPSVVHVLSLHICAQDSFSFPNAEVGFAADIDKHMVANFSSLDLHLETKGHMFGALVLHLIGMHRIQTAIRNLKIVLQRSEVKDACSADCLCVEPKDRETQSISLAGLEKVEIEGVEGEDHEFDFLEVIFRCAPALKHVTVKLSDEATPSADLCTKINNIVKEYPDVECNIDPCLGKQV